MKLWRAALRSIACRHEPAHRRLALSDAASLHTSARHCNNQPPEPVLPSEVPGDGSTVIPAMLRGLSESQNPAVQKEVAAYLRRNQIRHNTAEYGAAVQREYRHKDLLENPPSAADVTVELLMASQTHMGHATSLWHPANSKYIFGIREGIHILSMDITLAHLRRAATVVTQVTEGGGVILFVGSRKGFDRIVVQSAKNAGACHLFDRWVPGTITNGQQILERCGVKVVDEHDHEVQGFKDQLEARPVLKPDLVVCFNVVDHYTMLHECGLAGIPTIGIVDTDANPSWVTYPIPANDDSFRSVALIAGSLGRAGAQGLAMRKAAASRGETVFEPPANLNPLATDDEEDDGAEEDEDEDEVEAEDDKDDDAKLEQSIYEQGPDPGILRPRADGRDTAPARSIPASTMDDETSRMLSADFDESEDDSHDDLLGKLSQGESKQKGPYARRNVEEENVRGNDR